jgi:hypothetical protein
VEEGVFVEMQGLMLYSGNRLEQLAHKIAESPLP